MTTALMMAAGTVCAGKCPPHAIAAVAGAFAIGLLVGRLTKRGGKQGACKGHTCGNKATKGGERRERQVEPREPMRQPIPEGSVEIYVGNLSYEMTGSDLEKMFSEYGTVSSARVVTDRFHNRSKGFGFVVMPNRPEAEKAIAALSEKEHQGRKMRVNEAMNTIKEKD